MLDNFSEEQIKIRTDNRIKQSLEIGNHTCVVNGREYLVYVDVFSPAIFISTQWFTNALIEHLDTVDSFLEIGVGAGTTLVQVILAKKPQIVLGTDINDNAIKNTLVNLTKYGLNCQVVNSDVLEQIKKGIRYEVIYWNYPFHLKSDKGFDDMNNIERSIRDPGYFHLEKLLKTAKEYLTQNGKILLGFSQTLGNEQKLRTLAEANAWVYKIVTKTQVNTTLQNPSVCLIQLRPIH